MYLLHAINSDCQLGGRISVLLAEYVLVTAGRLDVTTLDIEVTCLWIG
jgi:hypothetical protein